MARRMIGRVRADSRMIHPRDWTWVERRQYETDILQVVFDYLRIGMEIEPTQYGD
jgi:hypothetical protein